MSETWPINVKGMSESVIFTTVIDRVLSIRTKLRITEEYVL